uniref:tRNA-binding domain-containing protein n=1 Tax=Polytomella parva TaxID=51329 RepID=A0A7S0YII0_9CHLO|mmetsp:Transcript_28465/g.52403  ORF Transcript_28465/g.52403 Transcript_28465/m.52403 type:complete len:266 (+) Transcript_28465:23-820(+)
MSIIERISKAITLVDEVFARASVSEPTPAAEIAAPTASPVTSPPSAPEDVTVPEVSPDAAPEKKEKKEKKPKKEPKAPADSSSPAAEGPAAGSPEAAFAKALIKVAFVLEAGDVENSDKLYKTKLDCGNGEIRQVLTGLKKLVSRDQLQGHYVCVIMNLKTAKLAGEVSEGMILSADQPLPDGAEFVRTIVPPNGSQAGDQVFLAGGAPSQTAVKTLKSDDWKKVAAGLKVGADKTSACFFEYKLVTDKGEITVPEGFSEGSGIH